MLASLLGIILAVLLMYSMSAFIQPMEASLGWSRTTIGAGITASTMATALFNTWGGAAIDRYGPRRVAALAIPVYVACFACLSLSASSVWSWWANWALLGVVNCFTGPALWTSAVARLFTRNRGLALAVAMCGTSVASICVPLTATMLIDLVGWRQAFAYLGIIFGTLSYVMTCFLPNGGSRENQPAHKNQASFGSLLLSARFMRLALAASFFALTSTALITSSIAIIEAGGVARDTAAMIAASVGITGIIGRLGSGFLVDRFDARVITAVAMALPALSAGILLADDTSIPFATVAFLIFGLALGAEFDLVAVFVSRLFDIRTFGALFGALLSTISVAAAVAPLAAGLAYDVTGEYVLLLAALVPISLSAAGLILTIGPVPRR
ncbi:MFS transporter [Sphingobium tyrosinilyticum]|uniref:MFS transporter n=1 Tax=Sphingobium tyrosinilyticum TaxID=2715436 RepID=A0ABV9F233_9SPHN